VKACLAATAAVSLLLTPVAAFAQAAATAYASAPDLPYEAVPNFFKMPPGDAMGEMQGVATNSKGDTFAFFRGPQTRLWEFAPDGKFLKEIGKGFYGFAFAHSVRVDRHDNIWTIDEGTNVITKFGDGGLGWPEQAPFDRILVTAAAPSEPKSLLRQLKPAGVLVVPIGKGPVQKLMRYAGDGTGAYLAEVLCEVRFVPLLDGVAREL